MRYIPLQEAHGLHLATFSSSSLDYPPNQSSKEEKGLVCYIEHFLGFADSAIPDYLRANQCDIILHNNHVTKLSPSSHLPRVVNYKRCVATVDFSSKDLRIWADPDVRG